MTAQPNRYLLSVLLSLVCIAGAHFGAPTARADDAPNEGTPTPDATPAPTDADQAIADAMRTLLHYHEHPDPDAVDPTLRTLMPSKALKDWSNAAFVMGFLTGVLRDNPDRVKGWYESWLPEVYKQDAYSITVFALAMSGNEQRNDIYEDMLEHSDQKMHAMIINYMDRDVEAPLEIRPAAAYHLPLLWGWYCATAETEALDRILEFTGLERDDLLPSDSAKTLSFAIGVSDPVGEWAHERLERFEEGDDAAHLQAGELEAILEDAPAITADPTGFGLTMLGVPATR